MVERLTSLAGLAQTLRSRSRREETTCDEARLYYHRACIAASEERYDVALVFAAKSLELAPRDLATRLLVAQIHDRGLHDVAAAVRSYEKVISLAGYDGANPYCAAARTALDVLVSAASGPPAAPPLAATTS